MQSAALRNLMLVGLLTPIAGCYSPYGYQSPYSPGPYGQPYQPTYPSGPIYNGPPAGQPYVPGGPTQPGMGSPTPLTPPGSNPPPTYDNNSGNGIKFDDAPTFNPNPGTTPPAGSSGGNRGTVPDPIDDTGAGPAAANPGLQPTSSIQRDRLESSFEQEADSTTEPAQPANADAEADPFFEPPKRLSGSTDSGPAVIRKVSLDAPTSEQLNPYGRDKKHANPEWLRGVIDFDSQARTWQIIYSATPDSTDPNGGSLTLGNHPALAQCRSGDVVLVEGAINAGEVDGRGKPKYLLDRVTQLIAPQSRRQENISTAIYNR